MKWAKVVDSIFFKSSKKEEQKDTSTWYVELGATRKTGLEQEFRKWYTEKTGEKIAFWQGLYGRILGSELKKVTDMPKSSKITLEQWYILKVFQEKKMKL